MSALKVCPYSRASGHLSEHYPTPKSTNLRLRAPAHPSESQPTPPSTSPPLRAPAHASERQPTQQGVRGVFLEALTAEQG
mmetsp:Transcript_9420/g.21231  ORF Transcript_9420/g.21231 Transcript_9420/m.21231 type:complete len:80 (+) Transcript_9420:496-735(+)